ncbi:TetR/AcrR family transcriptional regulator [Pseudogracilibacillus sp. SO30301A]|uniref:TetR/AcrR family transcriptional regulator n=1 Tax=Pseudogracilibacillus sp. SO30301A TaxID=3098291 RepID=UPI00300E2F30
MPRPTFFNLQEEKQQTLLQAAKKEFTRVSLAEASIANIVKEADIPRGSFYQYFENKQDLYFYLLNEHLKEKREELITNLRKHCGDIFASIRDLLQSLLTEMEEEGTYQFYRNVFLNMDYRTEKAFMNLMNYNTLDKKYDLIKRLINRKSLNIDNEEELLQVVQIVSLIMTDNLIQKFGKEMTNEEVIHNYKTQIRLLKKGFAKE